MTCKVFLLLGIACLLCVPSNVLASVTVNDDIVIKLWSERPSDQNSSQGPFHAVIYEDTTTGKGTGMITATPDFLTFCVERYQYFTPGARYNIDGISSQSTAPKLLSGYTAWVYSKFQALGLSPTQGPTGTAPGGGVYTWGQVMDLYQQAIWAGMIRDTGTTGLGDQTLGDIGSLISEFQITDWTAYNAIGIGKTSAEFATWGGITNIGSYQVLDIGLNNIEKQDQLFLVPPSPQTEPIPEPASLAIWSLIAVSGAAVMAGRRRRGGRWSDENRVAIRGIIERG